MLEKLILILSFVLTTGVQNAVAQFLLVQDSDRYVNVRGAHNKVIDSVPVGSIVWEAMPDFEWSNQGNSVYVAYPKRNKIYLGNIHSSRLKEISAVFPKMPGQKTSRFVTLKNDSATITIKLETPDKNKPDWVAYESIVVGIDENKFSLPKSACNDLIHLDPRAAAAYYDKETQSIYIVSAGGDGAEGYSVMWVVKKGRYQDRYIASTVPDEYLSLSQKGIPMKNFYRYIVGRNSDG